MNKCFALFPAMLGRGAPRLLSEQRASEGSHMCNPKQNTLTGSTQPNFNGAKHGIGHLLQMINLSLPLLPINQLMQPKMAEELVLSRTEKD